MAGLFSVSWGAAYLHRPRLFYYALEILDPRSALSLFTW